VAVFFLQQTPVESLVEEEAQESEYLRGAELPQAGPGLLPPLAVAEVVSPLEELRGAEILQQQSSGFLTRLQVPSRNTMPGVAGK
jgi:hypothetical protein